MPIPAIDPTHNIAVRRRETVRAYLRSIPDLYTNCPSPRGAKNITMVFTQAEGTAARLLETLSLLVRQLTTLRNNIRQGLDPRVQENLKQMIATKIDELEKLRPALLAILEDMTEFVREAINRTARALEAATALGIRDIVEKVLAVQQKLEAERDFLITTRTQLDVISFYANIMGRKNRDHGEKISRECQGEGIFNSLGLLMNLLKTQLVDKPTRVSTRLLQLRTIIAQTVTTI